MAITRITLTAPGNFSVTAVAGGTLPDATTYYARAFAIKSLTGAVVDSPWTAELSATTNSGAGLNSILIDFDDVAEASKYFVVITKVSGDYNETAKHTVSASAGLSSSTFTLTAESQIAYYVWYRPNGVPVIDIDGGSAGSPLCFEDIEDADIVGGWGNIFHEAVTNIVEYVLGNEISNSYVIDANLRFGANSTTCFKQTKASISLQGNIYCDPTYCTLFQLGDRAGSGRGGRYGCELIVRSGDGWTKLTAAETNLYDSIIHLGSSSDAGWRRTPYATAAHHTWSRDYLYLGYTGKTMRLIGCKVSGNWRNFRLYGSTIEIKWVTLSGLYGGPRGPIIFENLIVQESVNYGIEVLGGSTYRGCELVYGSARDMSWAAQDGATALYIHLVDCIFNSQNQGNNDPYGTWYGYSYVGDDDLLFEHQFDPIFVDTAGDLISGATVLLKDKNGTTIINDSTNASGKLTGGSKDIVRRRITCSPTSSGWPTGYLSAMIASGWYIEDVRNPHTLTVSIAGVIYFEATFDIEAKMTSYIVVNLERPDASADIEEFEKLRLGTTLVRDLRIRAGAALADTTDALLDLLERLRLGGSRFWRDLKLRAGTWEG